MRAATSFTAQTAAWKLFEPAKPFGNLLQRTRLIELNVWAETTVRINSSCKLGILIKECVIELEGGGSWQILQRQMFLHIEEAQTARENGSSPTCHKLGILALAQH